MERTGHERGGGGRNSAGARLPWADLGGNWGSRGLLAGGTVEDGSQDIARVRLTDSRGSSIEDTVDDGVVLFLSDEPLAMPLRVDLIDRDGRVVATDDWGFVDESLRTCTSSPAYVAQFTRWSPSFARIKSPTLDCLRRGRVRVR
jgi:hypothetical protein